MNKLLKKELRLTAAPITYFFLAFALMTLIPGYPILVGGFFITLGIFYTFQMARESNDILYTALLPCKKQDVVRAKYAFCVLIELLGWLLCAVLTAVRLTPNRTESSSPEWYWVRSCPNSRSSSAAKSLFAMMKFLPFADRM